MKEFVIRPSFRRELVRQAASLSRIWAPFSMGTPSRQLVEDLGTVLNGHAKPAACRGSGHRSQWARQAGSLSRIWAPFSMGTPSCQLVEDLGTVLNGHDKLAACRTIIRLKAGPRTLHCLARHLGRH